ncbi:MAG: hypothetical protein E6J62_08380 [Deltaproteobacteria bacterium]|nr:MAG: hypothetical protein E6J85_09000 [Deltaproteobacteria bacterium]TMB35025.1 MAG: hypothetical protein E6J61_02230 [Deltaproteobacteria bacterium]TMB35975.1 MAG: hypothetical protein E6J62_08380 [Deltaproteobacteria bacterium]
MTISARSLLALPVLALGFACAHDLNSVMTARVLSRSSGAARDATGLKPAEGAHIALNCPGGEQKDLGTTDSLGELRTEQPQAFPLACSFVVAQPGFQPYSVKISNVCTETGSDGCQHADLRAILASGGSGSAGGSR